MGLSAVRWGLFVLLAAPHALAVEYVNDPLTSASFAGRGNKGGSFSPSGWTTAEEPDAVWWEVAEALPSARIEYTVTGISTTTSLTGADHDIFTLYQAPTGQPEPIAYSPYFRNNDFKAFTRIFGMQEPGRNGAMKLELAFCPRGDPWHHDEVCSAACDGSALAYANGTDKDVGWDGSKAYRMAIEWGNGKMSFFRDNVELGSVSYPGTYAPKPLRVRLGSPRHDGVYPGAALMPKGLVFKDVLITGTPGAMTPVCGSIGTGGTAGAGGTPGDAGAEDAGSSENEYTVLADVTAASWETGVYPDQNDLNPEGDGASPVAVAYLRFPPVSGTVVNAVLKLRTAKAASAAGASGVICGVADDSWSETSMTWANRPPVGSSCVGVSSSVDPDMDVEWDVTALVKTGANVGLAVVSTDSNGVHYLSKEASATQGPRLYVKTTNAQPSDAGSGGFGNAGGISASGGAGTGGKLPSGGTNASDDGGCGCRTPSRSGDRRALVGAAFLIVAARRLRRRTRR